MFNVLNMCVNFVLQYDTSKLRKSNLVQKVCFRVIVRIGQVRKQIYFTKVFLKTKNKDLWTSCKSRTQGILKLEAFCRCYIKKVQENQQEYVFFYQQAILIITLLALDNSRKTNPLSTR